MSKQESKEKSDYQSKKQATKSIEAKTLADELTSKRAGVATINDKDKTKRRKTLF